MSTSKNELTFQGSTLLYLTTWLGTYEIWKRSLPFGIHPGLAMEFILHISCLSSLPMVVYNVYMYDGIVQVIAPTFTKNELIFLGHTKKKLESFEHQSRLLGH